ncbi:MAG: right-handed parallel beta-helix repeat-containing protein, partial [Pirellulales bacterium]
MLAIMVTTRADSGIGSLRAAIAEANLTAAPDVIEFQSTLAPGSITLTSASGPLPLIIAPLVITSQNHPSFSPLSPPFTLDGSQLTVGSGFQFNFDGASSFVSDGIRGLRITGFPDDGIEITELPDGHLFTAADNIIDGNGRISIGAGINVFGSITFGPEFEQLTIVNNTIVKNDFGIRLIDLDAQFEISDNRVGTSGTSTLDGNSSTGILIDSPSLPTALSTVDGNIISGNGGDGMSIRNNNHPTNRISVFDNIVGVNSAETSKIRNVLDGIRVENASVAQISANTISGNGGNGITVINTNGISILSNVIGADRSTSTADLGNTGAGIQLLSSTRNSVIGTNNIYFNDGDGIQLASTAGIGNQLSQNRFYANSGEPIDLNNDGATANDANDSDGGPNQRLNFPKVTPSGAYLAGDTLWNIPVQFDVDVPGTYRFELYRLRNGRLDFVRAYDTIQVPTTGSGIDLSTTLTVSNGTQTDRLLEGDQIAFLAIGKSGTGNNTNSTSELAPLTGPISAGPRINNVIVRSSTSGNSYSFAGPSAAGNQYVPVNFSDANQIQIQFTRNVAFGQGGAELTLRRANGDTLPLAINGFAIDHGTFTATWTFASAFGAEKYAIELDASTIVDFATGTLQLDGEWDMPVDPLNLAMIHPDTNPRTAQTLLSGSNDLAGGDFRFLFAVLPT